MIQEKLLTRCDLFVENYLILRKDFSWDNKMMLCLGGLLYANAGKKVQGQVIKDSKEIIKNNTGLFSSFKDTTFFAMSTLLSLEENREELFIRITKIYDEMKKSGFYSSPYLTLAAFSIAKGGEYGSSPVIKRAKEFYTAMKKEHRFLTSTDDYGYAAMLATTQLSVEQAVREMETCYALLKSFFGSGNALQSLTHVLTIGEEVAQEKCQRAIQIYESLARKGCKLSKYKELATLGILALISKDVEQITDEIYEVYQVLLDKKGFGIWSLQKHERTMYAAALVAAEYVNTLEQSQITLTLTNSLTNILIAQQTAVIVAASSAAAASAASSSS